MPVVLILVGLLILRTYPIDEEKRQHNRTELQQILCVKVELKRTFVQNRKVWQSWDELKYTVCLSSSTQQRLRNRLHVWKFNTRQQRVAATEQPVAAMYVFAQVVEGYHHWGHRQDHRSPPTDRANSGWQCPLVVSQCHSLCKVILVLSSHVVAAVKPLIQRPAGCFQQRSEGGSLRVFNQTAVKSTQMHKVYKIFFFPSFFFVEDLRLKSECFFQTSTASEREKDVCYSHRTPWQQVRAPLREPVLVFNSVMKHMV